MKLNWKHKTFLGAITLSLSISLDGTELEANVTTAAVLTIIIRCRINDKAAQLAHTKKAAANDNQNAEQQSKDQAAQAAEQRALQQREQAMAISKAA